MKVGAVILIAMSLTGTSVLANAQDQDRPDDKEAVRHIVQAYFEGHTKNDVQAENKAVHPQALWVFASKNNRLYISTQKQRTKTLKENARRVMRASDATLRIDSIDVTGGAACAKIEVESQLAVVTHYLLLLKDPGGEWKIVGGTVWPMQKEKK
ncbi:MAG: hypothetical protein EWM72_02860 [Nitrospira sp.]|nr:MAG: hypothetical protein EWM72_02860 [Nitrospira sp.]